MSDIKGICIIKGCQNVTTNRVGLYLICEHCAKKIKEANEP